MKAFDINLIVGKLFISLNSAIYIYLIPESIS